MTTVHKRVLKDITDGRIALKKEFGIYLEPEESDFYRVHFVLPGPEDTPFFGGLYHGMIRLNENHPYKPPNIHMITPNGRFVAESCPIPNGSRGICTTTSSFHPETWTPMNNLETVIKGFVSLMCDPFDGGVGGIKSTDAEIKKLARDSINHIKSDIFVKNLFPDLYNSVINGTYKSPNLGNLSKPSATNKIIVVDDFDDKNDNTNDKKKSKKSITKKSNISDTDEDSWDEGKPIKPTTKSKPRPKTRNIKNDDTDTDSESEDTKAASKNSKSTKKFVANDSDSAEEPVKKTKSVKKIAVKKSSHK